MNAGVVSKVFRARLTCVFLLLCLSLSQAWAAEPTAIIALIEPAVAGPHVHERYLVHHVWVRWPRQSGATDNRLLSLVTGLDWKGEALDTAFRHGEGEAWISENGISLERRGYYGARRTVVPGPSFPLAIGGSVSPRALLLATSQPGVLRSIGAEAAVPEGSLLLVRVRSWEELAVVRRGRQNSRILVVEYPPLAGREVSRLWMQGKGWPAAERGSSSPVVPTFRSMGHLPGLVPAAAIGPLVMQGKADRWEVAPSSWQGANRWNGMVQAWVRIVRGLLGGLALCLLIWGLKLMADERRSAAFGYAVCGAYLLVPASLLGGLLAFRAGAEAYAVTWIFAWVGLAAVSYGMTLLLEKVSPGVHSTVGTALVGLAGMWVSQVNLSPWSPVLESPARLLAPEPYAILLVGWAVAAAGTRRSRLRWGVWAAAVASGGLGFAMDAWWSLRDPLFSTLPLVACALGQGWLRWWMGLPLALGASALPQIRAGGLAYAPYGLITHVAEASAFNVWWVARFFVSPAFLIGAFAVGAVAVFSSSFAYRQARRVWAGSSGDRSLWHLAALVGVLGLLHPPLLEVAWVLGGGALLFLLDEGLWTSDLLV